MRAFLEKDITNEQRSHGTTREVHNKLKDFDKRCATGKLNALYKGLLNRRCPDSTMTEFKYFNDFRNSCFHGDPVVRLKNGEDQTTRKEEIIILSRTQGAPPHYPLLWQSNRPLSLTHAIRAIRQHDKIVQQLLGEPSLGYLLTSIEIQGKVSDSTIEGGLRKPFTSESLDVLSRLWDKLIGNGWEDYSGDEEDEQRLIIELSRKVNIRRVK